MEDSDGKKAIEKDGEEEERLVERDAERERGSERKGKKRDVIDPRKRDTISHFQEKLLARAIFMLMLKNRTKIRANQEHLSF